MGGGGGGGGGEYQGFVLYRQKRQCNENITDCRGIIWDIFIARRGRRNPGWPSSAAHSGEIAERCYSY